MPRGEGAGHVGFLSRLRRRDGREREVAKVDDAWREQLTAEQFRVLRKRGTERPFSNQVVRPDTEGVYRCGNGPRRRGYQDQGH